ncbi:MAG: DUF5694 domain-containing protein [Gammaproteobacteria bacterium]|nr:DUF5694 domain-containing protein [Gammaproteobacteria bacterium]
MFKQFAGIIRLAGLAFVAVLAFFPGSVGATHPETRIMVVGSFHFGGSESDGVSVTMGNMLSEGRQAEILDVIERLERFAPTKVMIEAESSKQALIDEQYAAYREGHRELAANERDQLGMRLASSLDHPRVFAVDHQQPMDFPAMMQAGQHNGQGDILEWFGKAMQQVEVDLKQAQSEERSLLDALRFHNGDWAMQGNSLYLKLVPLGTDDNPMGAEVIGNWYGRNLKIFANITRHLEPGDRAVVIYGSGHLAQLAEFVRQHPDYEFVSALEYLGDSDTD